MRVSTPLPGVIGTPGNRASQPDAGRSDWGSPERIARVALFLRGGESAPVSGTRIPVGRT